MRTLPLQTPPIALPMAINTHRPINASEHHRPSIRSLIIFFMILITATCTGAQNQTHSSRRPFSSWAPKPPTSSIVAIVIFVVFFAGFFSICIGRSFLRSSPAAGDNNFGLDPKLLASFRTMRYVEARKLELGADARECAVCLCEFEDAETIKMVPDCWHVYHINCIDVWLLRHVTCPICRADLTALAVRPPDQVAIDDGGDHGPQVVALARSESGRIETLTRLDQEVSIPRSKSVGTSSAGVESFTLKLPEMLKQDISVEMAKSTSPQPSTSSTSRRSWRYNLRPAKSEPNLVALDRV